MVKKLLFIFALCLFWLPASAATNGQNPNEKERTVWVEEYNLSVTTASQDPREIKYLASVEHMNRRRDEYFSLTPLQTTRENIKRAQEKAKQCKKYTLGLTENCDFALQVLIILVSVLLTGFVLVKVICKFKLFQKIRLYLNKRQSKHSLDDIFDLEKKQ